MTMITTPVNDLMRIAGRAAEITGSYGHTRTRPERIDGMARATLAVEHVHQELVSFVRFVYMKDPSGRRWLHLLPDGTLAPKVHTPWRGVSSTLTRSQQDRVRAWLALKCKARLRPPLLFDYGIRRWLVDLTRYPTADNALDWFDKHKLTPGEWLNLL